MPSPNSRALATAVTIGLVSLMPVGCSPAIMAGAPRAATTEERLAQLEQRYADTRDLQAQIRVTEARGADRSTRGSSLTELKRTYEVQRAALLETLSALDSASLRGNDARAMRTMRSALRTDEAVASTTSPRDTSCTYDARAVASAAGKDGREVLGARAYACYGRAARRVVIGKDTVDRLTVLGRLGTMDDSAARHQAFVALAPLWHAMNGDDSPGSPYRTLMVLSAHEWQTNGSYISQQAASLGLDPRQVEATLVNILTAWRDHTPPTAIEPWNWWFENGAFSRRLSSRVNKDELRVVNDRFYTDLGADPVRLGVHFDLDPRDGKTPVAFTDFGSHPRVRDKAWEPAEPWIFATYRVGGVDNLGELLHEMGHAVHIAAIETRPAFADWPDSDPFTEALGDLLALDLTEPGWQRKYLGDSATTAESMRSRYSGIVMDVAWALFELRMHAEPTQDPNALWATITSSYLHLVPHPEWSWWAMRGQLVDLPGYMMNYALGAVITADLRAKVMSARGPFWRADKKTYRWLSDRLYQWGLERETKDVLQSFLGRPVTADALLRDMQRLGSP
ncbi:MAG: hypothetical protein U0132_00485 [Gemmatimonadaceae bacterium]